MWRADAVVYARGIPWIARVLPPDSEAHERGPAGLVGGELVEREGCLLFDRDGSVSLPLWPPGTRRVEIDGIAAIAGAQGTVTRVGDVVRFGGGTDYPLDWAESQVGEIPAACEVGNYTLINSLDRQ